MGYSMQHAFFSPGDRIGKFEIVTRLAIGGMAEVWLARLHGAGGFQKSVVLKTMLPQLCGSPEMIEMFLREATLAANFDHPNIVQIFELGEQGGDHYIAMEYVQGRTLRQARSRVKRLGHALPIPFLLKTIAAVSDALHFAHEYTSDDGTSLGLVHRDVSPENIMITYAGGVKLLDFGVAKSTSHGGSLVSTGNLVGKFHYMSPEQIRGEPADRRCDVYALGVIMYESLTGRRPYDGANEASILARVVAGPPPNPREIVSTLPAELTDIVMKAMSYVPSMRYASADALKDDLWHYLCHHHASELHTNLAADIGRWFADAPDLPMSLRRKLRSSEQVAACIPTSDEGSFECDFEIEIDAIEASRLIDDFPEAATTLWTPNAEEAPQNAAPSTLLAGIIERFATRAHTAPPVRMSIDEAQLSADENAARLTSLADLFSHRRPARVGISHDIFSTRRNYARPSPTTEGTDDPVDASQATQESSV